MIRWLSYDLGMDVHLKCELAMNEPVSGTSTALRSQTILLLPSRTQPIDHNRPCDCCTAPEDNLLPYRSRWRSSGLRLSLVRDMRIRTLSPSLYVLFRICPSFLPSTRSLSARKRTMLWLRKDSPDLTHPACL
jgi:hypothetical protein